MQNRPAFATRLCFLASHQFSDRVRHILSDQEQTGTSALIANVESESFEGSRYSRRAAHLTIDASRRFAEITKRGSWGSLHSPRMPLQNRRRTAIWLRTAPATFSAFKSEAMKRVLVCDKLHLRDDETIFVYGHHSHGCDERSFYSGYNRADDESRNRQEKNMFSRLHLHDPRNGNISSASAV